MMQRNPKYKSDKITVQELLFNLFNYKIKNVIFAFYVEIDTIMETRIFENTTKLHQREILQKKNTIYNYTVPYHILINNKRFFHPKHNINNKGVH